jgi:hypothetical protein
MSRVAILTPSRYGLSPGFLGEVESSLSAKSFPVTAEPTNQGQYKAENNLKGEFKTTTRFQNFEVLITAETDPRTKIPSHQVVLKPNIQVQDLVQRPRNAATEDSVFMLTFA